MLSKTESKFLLPTKLGLVKLVGDETRIKIKYSNIINSCIKNYNLQQF